MYFSGLAKLMMHVWTIDKSVIVAFAPLVVAENSELSLIFATLRIIFSAILFEGSIKEFSKNSLRLASPLIEWLNVIFISE